MMLSLSIKHAGLETGSCFHNPCIHNSCVIMAMPIQQVEDGVNIRSQKKKKKEKEKQFILRIKKRYYTNCEYNLYKLKIKLSSLPQLQLLMLISHSQTWWHSNPSNALGPDQANQTRTDQCVREHGH